MAAALFTAYYVNLFFHQNTQNNGEPENIVFTLAIYINFIPTYLFFLFRSTKQNTFRSYKVLIEICIHVYMCYENIFMASVYRILIEKKND